ncbi:LysR family transcriptional regulator [Nocardioides hankookensis]|uniref:LysR family transcriptional regulator n=1 Tax=Nocardioides hankookensis TaxID=443157 RepID=A0ABW1LR59_9ACTN
MEHDSLRNLDLNLLRTLDALLQERHVTRAAERLGLSQPAVSAALSRLRRHFGDELLVRSGNRLELTALAEQLLGNAEAALAGVRRVFDATPLFDPETSRREFTLVTSDYATAILGEPLTAMVDEQAPGVRLRFQAQTVGSVDHPMETLRAVDGMVLPHGFLADIPVLDLYEDQWVCIVSADNDTVGDELTREDLERLPWVDVFHRPTAFTPALRQLQVLGVEPRVDVVVEQFLALPFMVGGTSRIAVIQAQLARRMAGPANVRVLPCPWDVVPLKEAFWYHPSHRADPAHAWLRQILSLAAETIERPAPGPREAPK